MITWCFDTREVILTFILSKGMKKSSYSYNFLNWLTGSLIKIGAIYVFIKQERGRLIRWMLNNRYKNDSGLEVYNLFSGRSDKIGAEQPESIYFMDKFM